MEAPKVNATLDHMLSLTIFVAALLIFLAFFSQSVQTAVIYLSHQALATKTSDLLDTMLLNPGLPNNWSKRDTNVVCFGLEDPAFAGYKLSPLSLMRLAPAQSQVYYSQTGLHYSNLSAGFCGYVIMPTTRTLSYSTGSKLLGINGTYGFQLTLTPTITVSAQRISNMPLAFNVDVAGTGFPLANATVTYTLLLVDGDESPYSSYTELRGERTLDAAGSTQVTFSDVDGSSRAYALIVYAHLFGLKGVGYYVNVPWADADSVVPLVNSFSDRNITLVHSDVVGETPQPPPNPLSYNASFVIQTEEYWLRRVPLDDQTGAYGALTRDFDSSSVVVPDNDGILVVTYRGPSPGEEGIVLVPWGLGSLGFPLTFGGNSEGQAWVSTDARQVTVGGVAYQAQLALWSLKGYRGVG
jgi:hypothetical protein